MVSTRQMSITTVGPEIGAIATNRNGTNSTAVAIQSGSSTSSLRQHSSTATVGSVNANSGVGGASSSGGGVGDGGVVCNVNKDAGTILKPKQLSLQDMPFEIQDKILSYVGYKQVSSMRLVSSQMNQTCMDVLNSTFTKLQTQLIKRMQNIKKVMPRRESARRSHPLSSECDIVETCCMRLQLLQMAFGRYIEHKHCCFFPGAILDEVYNVINILRINPHLGRPYKITEELIDLSTMAMEYFKDHLEPTLPQFGLLSLVGGTRTNTSVKSSAKKGYLFESTTASTSKTGQSSSMPSPPQSNMVLRKGIRKIKQGMKKYNNQLTVLRTDLRFCKRKSTDQAKQITELQNMLAEQQKQTIDYANRLDENDKKNEEMSRKISTLLQELNKCKIELHYWRSRSPGVAGCNNCGQTLTVPSAELINELMNQSMGTDDMNALNAVVYGATTMTPLLATSMSMSISTNARAALSVATSVQTNATEMDDMAATANRKSQTMTSSSLSSASTMASSAMAPATMSGIYKISTIAPSTTCTTPITHSERARITGNNHNSSSSSNGSNSVILTVGTPRFYGKRKANDDATDSGYSSIMAMTTTAATPITTATTTTSSASSSSAAAAAASTTTNNIANAANNSNISDNYNKKARRVQNKIKCQTNNVNIKTRNK